MILPQKGALQAKFRSGTLPFPILRAFTDWDYEKKGRSFGLFATERKVPDGNCRPAAPPADGTPCFAHPEIRKRPRQESQRPSPKAITRRAGMRALPCHGSHLTVRISILAAAHDTTADAPNERSVPDHQRSREVIPCHQSQHTSPQPAAPQDRG